MHSARLIAVTISAGAIAGLAMGACNMILTEPFLDSAIEREAAGGGERDGGFWAEHDAYRQWQKGGMMISSVVFGVAAGSVYGIVYALYSHRIPGARDATRALVLAGAMWAALYIVPFAKYPAGLPGDGDPATIASRTAWYVALVALSGGSAMILYHKARAAARARRVQAIGAYVAIIAAAAIAMPDAAGAAAPDGELLWFRIGSVAAMSAYWAVLAVSFGAMWERAGLSRARHAALS